MSRFQCFIFLKMWITGNYKWWMSTMKNDQMSLYCHFNKIIKGPATSFQSPAFSQKHAWNIFHTVHLYLTKFNVDRIRDSLSCTMQQCLWWRHKIWNLRASQKHKNLDITRTKHYFSFRKKNSLLTHQALLDDKE